jgi:D-glycero-D-manno-heptose 1,7-bisphosphate phosphatase
MNKAIFLDRDGVINTELGDYITRPEDFTLNPGVGEALRRWAEAGYLLIVITNQGGIGKGLYNENTLAAIHEKLQQALAIDDVALTAIYHCPHHPSTGYCLCRKPDSLMIEKALARFHIDPKQSFFIGDKDRDIEAGLKAGVKGIRIESNASLTHIDITKHL